ncbi:MAG: AraC family transcriptional regulator [Eubacteriales bacterium]|nr:AraC family transcriptional regulator [Eubacteriales bacterium]
MGKHMEEIMVGYASVHEYEHEIVRPDDGLPARYFFSNDGRPAMVPLHYHDAVEIMYCTKGCVSVTKGNETFLLQEGDTVVYNINEMHMTLCRNSYTTAYVIQILAPFVQTVSGMSETSFRVPLLSDGNATLRQREQVEELERSIESFFTITKELAQDPCLFIRAQGSLCEILYQLFRNFQDTQAKVPHRNQKNYDRIRRIREYIDSHYAAGISLENMAAHIGVSTSYFSRFFTENFGQSFLQYLYQIRLEHAYVDVITTNTPLLEAALDNGFSSYSLFNTKFKETYGLTPAQARRLYSGQKT